MLQGRSFLPAAVWLYKLEHYGTQASGIFVDLVALWTNVEPPFKIVSEEDISKPRNLLVGETYLLLHLRKATLGY